MKSYKQLKADLLTNYQTRAEYDKLRLEFVLIEKLTEKRLKRGISQAILAKKMGTKQSAISRFESGSYSPTLGFLYKVADALDTKLKVSVSQRSHN